MNDWQRGGQEPEGDSDRDLKEADILLEKADALLRKHKTHGARGQLDHPDDELPLLTDVIDDLDDSADPEQASHAPAGGQTVELAESLIDLDTALTREIEAWFATELPQLIARELDKLPGRLREEAVAHMRATLLPGLSEQLSNRLQKAKTTKTRER